MAKKHPTTIDEYIRAAPSIGQTHLREVHAILKQVAPDAQEVIKWNTPFFVEPRFLFAFSAYKAHLSFSPGAAAFKAFEDELKAHTATKGTLKVPYGEPVPADLIRRMAERSLAEVQARTDDNFW